MNKVLNTIKFLPTRSITCDCKMQMARIAKYGHLFVPFSLYQWCQATMPHTDSYYGFFLYKTLTVIHIHCKTTEATMITTKGQVVKPKVV